MNKTPLADVIAHCTKEDPLNEVWLWAQAAGLAVGVAAFGCAVLTISNCVVITYSAVMARLCCTDFSLAWYTPWQDTASSVAILLGLVLGVGALFLKISLRARYGSAVVKRNIQLALDIEDAAALCQSILPGKTVIHSDTPMAGQLTIHMEMDETNILVDHLIIRVIPTGREETTILIDAAPMVKGSWRLVSSFFTDYGQNKMQVGSLVSQLKPYMANRRRSLSSVSPKRKRSLAQNMEQIRREAPPRLKHSSV